MLSFNRFFSLALFLCLPFVSLLGVNEEDQTSIEAMIQDYTEAWNLHAGKGFANHFTDDADFVNIFGMIFKGKKEIEMRHRKILETIMKDSKLEIIDLKLREAQPGVMIALVHWKLDGFRLPGSDLLLAGDVREGIFTHALIQEDKKWKITATQNTLIFK